MLAVVVECLHLLVLLHLREAQLLCLWLALLVLLIPVVDVVNNFAFGLQAFQKHELQLVVVGFLIEGVGEDLFEEWKEGESFWRFTELFWRHLVLERLDSLELSLVELTTSGLGLGSLAIIGQEGKVTVDDLTGGTFTITNAGNIGGLFATPVINFPEVAICGVHAIKDTPVIRDGACVPGKKMYLSVSIDHRLVDGATGAHWMNVVKDHLEQPYRMLLG